MTASKGSLKPTVTKRQKRKTGPNPSNTWKQQPKIKSMAAREKAYVRMAGLANANVQDKDQTRKATKAPLNPDDDVINSPEYKFGRLLASPVALKRHSTILKLREYLKARTDPNNDNGGLSVLDLMKLWKGLWHTLYLCDGVVVQEEVSKVLASLIWSVGGTQEEDEYAGRFYLELDEDMMDGDADIDSDMAEMDDDDNDEMQIIEVPDDEDITEEATEDVDELDERETDQESIGSNEEEVINPADEEETKHCRGAHLSALYIRTYFRTLTREWSDMDKYRIDKFYTLTRFILREVYRYMSSRHWNLGIIRLFNDAIFEEVLRENKYGNGVRFHLLDICLDELALVNSEKETTLPLTEATFLDSLEPYFAMAQRVDEKKVHERVMEKVLDRFLDEYSIVSDNYSNEHTDESEKKKLVMDQVHVQTVAQFIFELASDSETQDRYRKQLYDMHKSYMKRVKQVGRDVIMTEDVDDDMAEESSSEKFCEKQCGGSPVEEASSSSTSPVKDQDTKKKKKKKKKSKEKRKDDVQKNDNVQKNDDVPEQESIDAVKDGAKKDDSKDDIVITISSKEQKTAAKATAKAEKKAKKAQKTAAKKASDNDSSPSSAKKVKFGKFNISKSYKASMQDLKKIDAKAILERTPSQGILRSKQRKAQKKKNKK